MILSIFLEIGINSPKDNVCKTAQNKLFKVTKAVILKDKLNNSNVLTQKPEVVVEANGVYSAQLQSFLNAHQFNHYRINPLKKVKKAIINNISGK